MLRKLNVLHRKAPKHVAFTNVDRLVFAGLYRLALDAVKNSQVGEHVEWTRERAMVMDVTD